jgi:hypothetical protein
MLILLHIVVTPVLIAGDLAAEQRTIVADSTSYGFNRPQTHPAPAGATEIWRTPLPIY